MMKDKLSYLNKEYKNIQKIKRHPAVLLYLSSKGLSWSEVLNNKNNLDKYINQEDYKAWRDKMLKHVVHPLKIEFEALLPYNLIYLYDYLIELDISLLLEVAENIIDIAYDNPVGTIRRIGWSYIKHNPEINIIDWINSKIKEIESRPESKFSYLEVVLYVYWRKRLKVVKAIG